MKILCIFCKVFDKKYKSTEVKVFIWMLKAQLQLVYCICWCQHVLSAASAEVTQKKQIFWRQTVTVLTDIFDTSGFHYSVMKACWVFYKPRLSVEIKMFCLPECFRSVSTIRGDKRANMSLLFEMFAVNYMLDPLHRYKLTV